MLHDTSAFCHRTACFISSSMCLSRPVIVQDRDVASNKMNTRFQSSQKWLLLRRRHSKPRGTTQNSHVRIIGKAVNHTGKHPSKAQHSKWNNCNDERQELDLRKPKTTTARDVVITSVHTAIILITYARLTTSTVEWKSFATMQLVLRSNRRTLFLFYRRRRVIFAMCASSLIYLYSTANETLSAACSGRIYTRQAV